MGASALLRIVRLPVAAPAEEGSNWTTKVDDWPGDRVPCTGDIEKPVPVTAALPVIDELPVFVTVTGKVEVVFGVTLPKDKLDGVTDKVEIVARGYKFKEKLCGAVLPPLL